MADDLDCVYTPNVKRRKQDPKTGKGLRHFSMKVCEKVKCKGTTTYNEVADELVAEFSADPNHYGVSDSEPFDQKNIRRRVYDALNVLMAMNIISKEKKEIKWIGLPTNAAQECSELEEEKRKLIEKIDNKRQQVRDLILQQIAYKKLVERNRSATTAPAPNAIIKLPFIIINTDKKTVIDCSISNDKSEYLFILDNAFEIHDDIEVLKRMGLTVDLEKANNPHEPRASSHQDESSSQASSNHENNDAVASHTDAREILPKALHAEYEDMLARTKLESQSNSAS